MHILGDLRALEAERQAGRITPEEYAARFASLEARETDPCETDGCTRPAYILQRGKRRCAVCALKERNSVRGRA